MPGNKVRSLKIWGGKGDIKDEDAKILTEALKSTYCKLSFVSVIGDPEQDFEPHIGYIADQADWCLHFASVLNTPHSEIHTLDLPVAHFTDGGLTALTEVLETN